MTTPPERIEEISQMWQKLGIEKCLSQMINFHHQELQKAREEELELIIRKVNSFSKRYPEYGVRLYKWEDGTLGMDTMACEDSLNGKQGYYAPYLYKEALQSELDQPTNITSDK